MLIGQIARKGWWCCAFLAATSFVGLSQTSAVSPAGVSPATVSPAVVSPTSQADAVFIKEFYARLSKYLDLRKKEAGSPPKPTKSAIKLAESKKAMAEKIQAARADAKQGDIFTPEIEVYFRKRIAAALKGRNGTHIRTVYRCNPFLQRCCCTFRVCQRTWNIELWATISHCTTLGRTSSWISSRAPSLRLRGQEKISCVSAFFSYCSLARSS